MLNCRSIPAELWVYARKCLIFYFYRRHGMANAEDLAQDTLVAVWGREDYGFEKEEDFLKVCYGFARKIRLEGYRDGLKHAGTELPPGAGARVQSVKGLEGSEVNVFLEEVRRRAEAELLADELDLIEAAVNRDSQDSPAEGKHRVKLHRARKKLAKLTGWH